MDKSTHVRVCWIPSHCGIEGNERVDQLAQGTFDHIEPLASIHNANFEATGQLLYTAVGMLLYIAELSFKTNIRATEEIPTLNQNWRGCNHPISIWPYYRHQGPYLVPRTADLSQWWSIADHWPYAFAVCDVTGKSWWILHCWLIKYSQDTSKQFPRLA